ncbi:class I SAM-dependent methyltransferase [Actinomadura alba]|uniref:Class I SAM-dependent methyltransferase n=1 Tax=Actinomadura alba TaxID=406431 RepID=A0ABR7LUS2_9ACTN|nr:methyltransferase domain-containing protein [Actinomadura alba]MBC6468205.1 class I SAM-dependent methyltransferase [Actinomadura alba]
MAEENAVYTHGHHASVLRSHRWRTAGNSAAYLIERLRPGVSLLDVGCGPATITADLAALVAPGVVTAVDAAPDVLEEAGRLAAERGLDNVEFAVADVHALPYPDETFDVVHAHQVLQHVTDPVGALREMRRVCAADGIVAARDADYAAMTWYPATPGLDEWLSLYRRVARANGGEPDAGRRLLSWAQQAGFRDITSTGSVWCFSTPDDRAWWSETWSERVVRSAFAERAMSGGHATRDDLERLSDAWRAWGAAEDGWFTILHGEISCRP